MGHVDDHLVAYLHEELTPDRMRRVTDHLQRCPRCRAECDSLRKTGALLGRLPLAAAPGSLWGRVAATSARDVARAAGSAPGGRTLTLRRPALVACGSVLVLLLGVAVARRVADPARSPWPVVPLGGAPLVGGAPLGREPRLRVGEWLQTDAASRARLTIPEIASVEAAPNTRLRRIAGRAYEQRLSLVRGVLDVTVSATPGRFVIETPAAGVVDLGCAYWVGVDDRGHVTLRVRLGRVALVRGPRSSIVPAGARCEAEPVVGPGTPHFEDAPAALRAALDRFDFAGGGASALAAVLSHARPRDALTLWHLLRRVPDPERMLVHARLSALAPPPPGVTRYGALNLDRKMLEAWREQIEMREESLPLPPLLPGSAPP